MDGSTWTKPRAASRACRAVSRSTARSWIDGGPTIIASRAASLGTIRSNGSGGWTTTTATGLTPDLLGTITAFDGGLLAVGGCRAPAPRRGSPATDRPGGRWRYRRRWRQTRGSIAGVAVRDGRAILVGAVAEGTDNAVSSIWTGSADLVRP